MFCDDALQKKLEGVERFAGRKNWTYPVTLRNIMPENSLSIRAGTFIVSEILSYDVEKILTRKTTNRSIWSTIAAASTATRRVHRAYR